MTHFEKKKRTLITGKLILLYYNSIQSKSNRKHCLRNPHVLFSFRYCYVFSIKLPPIFTAHDFFALKYAFSFSPVPPAFSALSAHFSKCPKLSFFSLVPQKGHSKVISARMVLNHMKKKRTFLKKAHINYRHTLITGTDRGMDFFRSEENFPHPQSWENFSP